ncbi:membrane-spanning 4-domains subfamily A member 4A-like [Dendropsophus ebraccatus]|uniref:membrane-spanning 4-domains subfamily A member 4A-like n=1 Tax=Dendropsophus ebraccatus TaxID=150705 RepID=UPI003832295F
MSTLTTDEGGFVIISQVSPQNKETAPEEGQFFHIPANTPKPLAAFYRGEPEVLGNIQIFVGILFMSFGGTLMILCQTECPYLQGVVYTGTLLWSGALFVVSGSLSLAAAVQPTLGMVRSSLVMNIISVAVSCTAIIFIMPSFLPTSPDLYCVYEPRGKCIGAFNPTVYVAGTMVFLFLLSTLMLCITISTSVFGCKTACRTSFNEMSVIVYQSTTLDAHTEVTTPSTTVLDS